MSLTQSKYDLSGIEKDQQISPAPPSYPTKEEIEVLSSMERFAFRVAHRMNQGRAKKILTFCQKTLGAGWIHLSTYNIMRIYGLEHVEAVSHDRPLLLVANHRSFFDMYAVSAMLFRLTDWEKQLFFSGARALFLRIAIGNAR